MAANLARLCGEGEHPPLVGVRIESRVHPLAVVCATYAVLHNAKVGMADTGMGPAGES